MTLVVAPTESAAFAALRGFLLQILPAGVEVFQSQDNRVPEPRVTDFVTMNAIRRERLSTNYDTPAPADTLTDMRIMQATKITFQLDVHGPSSADNAQMITTLFRDEYATNYFATANPAITPLYADDARQIPFNNGEQQVEDRWVIETALQMNALITVVQQYADRIDIGLVNVEEKYPAS